ncbi:uncharacterized protein LOC144141957 [Haemaphysalis longicornis]
MMRAGATLIFVGLAWVATTARHPQSFETPRFCTLSPENQTDILKCLETNFTELQTTLTRYLGENYHANFSQLVCSVITNPGPQLPASQWTPATLQALNEKVEPLVRKNYLRLPNLYDDCEKKILQKIN